MQHAICWIAANLPYHPISFVACNVSCVVGMPYEPRVLSAALSQCSMPAEHKPPMHKKQQLHKKQQQIKAGVLQIAGTVSSFFPNSSCFAVLHMLACHPDLQLIASVCVLLSHTCCGHSPVGAEKEQCREGQTRGALQATTGTRCTDYYLI
jgi:hypothetical protein